MLCDVCGRENADTLTFCQDCGRRLKPAARAVPPTPPAGLPKVELPARGLQPIPSPLPIPAHVPSTPPFALVAVVAAPQTPSPDFAPAPLRHGAATPASGPARSRPEVPPFYLGPSLAHGPAEELARAVAAPPAEPPPGETCTSCRAVNPVGYRFCVACGTALAAKPEPRAEPPAAPATPAAPPPTPVRPAEDERRIVGAPVVELAPSQAPPDKLLECSRCHGFCSPGTRFCKYCGAPLERATPSAIAATPAPTNPAAGSSPLAFEPALHPSAAAPPPATPHSGAATMVTLAPAAARATANSTRTGRLVVIVEDGSEGRSFALGERQLDIGRSEGDILLQDDLYVSPRHARLVPEGDRLVLRDLDSTNKVYLRIRKAERLRDGDLLLVGLEVLQFQTVSEAERGLGQATEHGTLLFGSPATPRRARLAQRTVEGVAKDIYHLFRDETVLGREMGDIVFTADPFLSRRHAAVRRNPSSGEFSVIDLESSNGTYLAIREDVTLADGDFVRIGQHLFRVDLA